MTEAEGADNLAHHAICDDPIVDRERVLGNLLDEAPIKRPGLQYAPSGRAGKGGNCRNLMTKTSPRRRINPKQTEANPEIIGLPAR